VFPKIIISSASRYVKILSNVKPSLLLTFSFLSSSILYHHTFKNHVPHAFQFITAVRIEALVSIPCPVYLLHIPVIPIKYINGFPFDYSLIYVFCEGVFFLFVSQCIKVTSNNSSIKSSKSSSSPFFRKRSIPAKKVCDPRCLLVHPYVICYLCFFVQKPSTKLLRSI